MKKRGGKRIGAGRKKLPVGMKRLPRKFYLDDKQYEIVKKFVIELKKGVLQWQEQEKQD